MSASFNLANFFEASKEGEADCVMRLLKASPESQSQLKPLTVEEVSSLLKENPNNKNAQSLIKCIELIHSQSSSLTAKKADLTSNINQLVKNTAGDIRKLRLDERAADMFSEDLNMSLFDERDACKKAFLVYLSLAKTILKFKQEMVELYRKLDGEIMSVDHMIGQYTQVIENIRVCLDGLVIPEIERRKHFDAVNKQFVAYYEQWMEHENKAREEFFNKGDLDQLPFAFKKVLVSLVFDDDIKVNPKKEVPIETATLEQLTKSMEEYFKAWSKPCEAPLKGKLESYLAIHEHLKSQLECKTLEYNALNTNFASLDKALFESNNITKQYQEDKNKLQGQLEACMKEISDKSAIHQTELSKLKAALDDHARLANEFQNNLTMSTADMTKIQADLNSRSQEVMSLKAQLCAVDAELSESRRSATAYQTANKDLEAKIQNMAQNIDELSKEREKIKSSNDNLTAEIDGMNRSLRDMQIHIQSMEESAMSNDSRISELQSSVEQLESKNNSLNNESADIRTINDRLRSGLSETNAKIISQEKEIYTMTDLVKNLQQTVEHLEVNLKDSKKKAEDFRHQMKKIQEQQINTVKTKTQNLVEANVTELKNKDSEIKALKDTIEILQLNMNHAKEDGLLTQSTIHSQEDEMGSLFAQLSEMQNTLAVQRQQEAIAVVEKEDLTKTIQDLEGQLNSQQTINKTLEDELGQIKHLEEENAKLHVKLDNQTNNYEAKINILQSMLGSVTKVESSKIIEIAIKKIHDKLTADFEAVCKKMIEKADKIEKRSVEVRENTTRMIGNNQMGILLTNLSMSP